MNTPTARYCTAEADRSVAVFAGLAKTRKANAFDR